MRIPSTAVKVMGIIMMILGLLMLVGGIALIKCAWDIAPDVESYSSYVEDYISSGAADAATIIALQTDSETYRTTNSVRMWLGLDNAILGVILMAAGVFIRRITS